MNSTKPMMTTLLKYVSCALLAVFLVSSVSTRTALAQDDQAYKKAYNAGLEAYKAKKLDEAYKQWERAAKLAEQAGDAEIAQKANYYVTQLDYKRGLQAYKNDQYEQALNHFNKGIEHQPTYANNYLGKGLTLKKMERFDDAIAVFVEARTVGEENKDRAAVQKADEAIRDNYIFLASSALSKGGETPSRSAAQTAISHLEKMQEYVEADADTYYYLATAQNALGNYDEAVAMADKALEMHRGSKTDKAKIYFVKGEALMYAGNTAAAKDAFRNAAFGSFKAPAEHYLETL